MGEIAEAGTAIPAPMQDAIRHQWQTYDAALAAGRYWAVNAIFDIFISDQLPRRRDLWARLRALRGQVPAAELAAVEALLTTLPLSEHEADRAALNSKPGRISDLMALAQMLQMLAPFDLDTMSEAERVHLVAESMRRAFHDRTFYLGDPDFVKVPQRTLTSPYYAAGLRSTINRARATPSDLLPGEPTPFLEHDETTHFSIIDDEGNRVGGTQTVNLLYGSGLIPPGTGFLLNNEMDDFALKPGTPNAFGVMGYAANAPEPGKRMLSSMTPTFMESDDRVTVIGTPGGTRIITMVLLGMLGYADGLQAEQVSALPRYHHQWLPDVLGIEKDALPADVITRLRAMGHDVLVPGEDNKGRRSSDAWGNMNTVEWDRKAGVLRAASDPRNPEGQGQVSNAR